MRDNEPRLMLEETGKHGNLQTYCGGEESLPERWVKGVVGARGADGPEPGLQGLVGLRSLPCGEKNGPYSLC